MGGADASKPKGRTMNEPFVRIEKHKGDVVILVEYTNRKKRYPLTQRGCIQAGEELFKSGAESWMNSSSVDFPRQFKKWFAGDVRELMALGFQAQMDKEEAPRKSLVAKMMGRCGKQDFQSLLTTEEKEMFVELANRIEENQ